MTNNVDVPAIITKTTQYFPENFQISSLELQSIIKYNSSLIDINDREIETSTLLAYFWSQLKVQKYTFILSAASKKVVSNKLGDIYCGFCSDSFTIIDDDIFYRHIKIVIEFNDFFNRNGFNSYRYVSLVSPETYVAALEMFPPEEEESPAHE